MGSVPTAHLLVGLPGSGKSTLARLIARDAPAVRFTLDEWMLRLHGLAHDDPSYAGHATTCRALIRDTAAQVLATGVDVVLDWSHWSAERRAESATWARGVGADAVVHHVTTGPTESIARAAARETAHTHRVDAAGVRRMAGLLEPPEPSEGWRIVRH